MFQNLHRSAKGKYVDMNKLLNQNELVPAVSNVKVNARGDELGPGGQIIRKREDVMAEVPATNTPTQMHPGASARPAPAAQPAPQYVSPPVPAATPVISTELTIPNGLKENSTDKSHNKGKQ